MIRFSGTSACSLNCKSWSTWANLPRQAGMCTVIGNAFLCQLRELGTIIHYGWSVIKGNSKEIISSPYSITIKCRKRMTGLSFQTESICFGKIKFIYADLKTSNMPLQGTPQGSLSQEPLEIKDYWRIHLLGRVWVFDGAGCLQKR